MLHYEAGEARPFLPILVAENWLEGHPFLKATLKTKFTAQVKLSDLNTPTAVSPTLKFREARLCSHGHYHPILKLEVRSQPFITLNSRSKWGYKACQVFSSTAGHKPLPCLFLRKQWEEQLLPPWFYSNRGS